MQIEQSTITTPDEIVIQFKLSDFDEQDVKDLLERSKKPLTSPIGAGLNAVSFLSAYEVLSLYLCMLRNGDPDKLLQSIRKKYEEWAIKVAKT